MPKERTTPGPGFHPYQRPEGDKAGRGAAVASSAPDGSVHRELDAHRLAQRQKQIDFGKNTIGYDLYLKAVPKCVGGCLALVPDLTAWRARSVRKRGDPQTPNKCQDMSKRRWDGLVRQWRRLLHKWDPPGTAGPGTPDGGDAKASAPASAVASAADSTATGTAASTTASAAAAAEAPMEDVEAEADALLAQHAVQGDSDIDDDLLEEFENDDLL